jgi:hypothetical protein
MTPSQLSDDQLLTSIARLYDAYDPAPPDLADGVLARLAVEDLESEYEMLTLVERVDLSAGVRSAEDTVTDGDRATVALEFAGSSYRVLVRISTVDNHRRLDGWVVPAAPMDVMLGLQGDAPPHVKQSTQADETGRFEFPTPPTGQVRLWLIARGRDETGAPVAPFVTPPFLI